MSAADSAVDAADDVLEGVAFDNLYTAKIEPELETLEQRRKSAFGLFLAIAMVGAIPLVGELLFLPNFQLLIITAVLTGALAYVPLARVQVASKEAIINALCAPLAITYTETKFEAPAFATFLSLHLLPRPDDSTFQDLFSGRHGEVAFQLWQATCSQGSGKSRHVVFRGQVFRITTPRKLLGTTVVLRDTGWLDRFECPQGLKKVGLEDPRFEQVFEVFGSDQVEAREILTPTFMEQLLKLEQSYAGERLRCGFVGPDLMIAVEAPLRFGVGNMFTTLVDRTRVQRIAADIEAVFKLIDEFNGA